MQRASLAILALLAALPAAAQERGGVSLRNPVSELNAIDANQGCPLSATSVTVGVNKATGTGSSAQQQLGTFGGSGIVRLAARWSAHRLSPGPTWRWVTARPLASPYAAKGPSGVLATTTFTRGVNIGFGAGSTANQRIFNQTGR